jgi:DNA-binding NtrC family response regulator
MMAAVLPREQRRERTLITLLERLAIARTFEDATATLLQATLDVAEETLAASPYAGGRILRAMVHLRPDDGYVHLVGLEAARDGARGALAQGGGMHLPSATAWRWVEEHARSVEIDLVAGAVKLLAGPTLEELPALKLDGQGSLALLVDRDVTHLFVVPLRAPGGPIDGMLCVEAQCQEAIGEPFPWGACDPPLETLAAAAGAYVTRLPVTPVEKSATDPLLPVVGASMGRVIAMLRVFAEQEETLLLSGPTGAGKSRLARWCHERSRVPGPFEVLDLATVPEELQLAELFGWRKGAFTDAARDTPGALMRAEGGTLFIDEIDKLSLRAQAGLLRVLEEKKFRQLGAGSAEREARVRFVIGTNGDLHALARRGQFREDLYYRINVLPVRVPCLRDRADEIVPWARYMLQRRAGVEGVRILPEAARLLAAEPWPGNLRQLDNIVRRAHALSLITRGGADAEPTLGPEDVARALAYEHDGKGSPTSVLELWERAAEAFVTEAERRALAGEPRLDLDLVEAFKGQVIEMARRRLGGDEKESVRRAYLLLGKEGTVESRNQGAHHRRELEKLHEARRILAGPAAARAPEGAKPR